MSGASSVINGIIEQKLLNLHTAYFAKVISVSGNTAKIQPLNMVKAVGKNAKKQAVMTVPILQNVKKFKEGTRTITVSGERVSFSVLEAVSISAGDTVLCLCGERDITETKKGNFAIPPVGHHRLSDSVIVGVM